MPGKHTDVGRHIVGKEFYLPKLPPVGQSPPDPSSDLLLLFLLYF